MGLNQQIADRFTCDGENVNPPLAFSGIPYGTRSLCLIVVDPDAPKRNFTHWILFDIPPNTTDIPENTQPSGSGVGRNDFGHAGYGGPCPPLGTHRYVFTLLALDTTLDLPNGVTKEDLLKKVNGHILDSISLTGLYTRG